MAERRAFSSLPVDRQRSAEAMPRPARVCIATFEFLGPSHNGGIGTAYYSLASALAAAGHEVTVLYLLGDRCETGTISKWQSYFRAQHLDFVPLPAAAPMPDVPEAAATSRDAYRWLRTRDFDVIHFPELLGHGYYSELAKHQGLDFQDSTICIGTHSPMTWIREINREAPYSPDEIEIDFLEHQSVRLADVVVSPSYYLLNWIVDRGWELPSQCHVQQYILSPGMQAYWQEQHQNGAKARRVEEFVFFGRLEERKGLRVFCDALDRLAKAKPGKLAIAFVGKSTTVAGRDAVSYIENRSRSWPFAVQVLTSFDQTAALRFLRERPGRIAIMPSLEDNLPNTVLECLCARIPFLAARTGGIPEMIAAEDLPEVTIVPAADELGARLARALKEGVRLARPAIDPDQNRLQWIQWHAALASQRDEFRQKRPQTSPLLNPPRVSVCLSWRERPEALPEAVAAFEAQDWPNFEVVLVDQTACGVAQTASGVADAHDRGYESLDSSDWQRRFDSRGWRIIREPRVPDALARDRAAAEATGDYLLFSDERSVPKSDGISTFIRVAAYSHADILSCFLDLYAGNNGTQNRTELGCHPFLGGAIVPGIFRNYLGDGHIFISKSAFHTAGGFTAGGRETRGYWEFLARAVFAGLRLEVVPRALAALRLPEDLRPLTQAPSYRAHLRALRPYSEAMPAALKDLPTAALIMKLHYERQYHLAQVAAGNEPPKLTDDELLALVKERLAERGQERIIEQLLRMAQERLMTTGYDRQIVEQLLHMTQAQLSGSGYDRQTVEQLLHITQEQLSGSGYDRQIVEQLLRITQVHLSGSSYDEKILDQLLRMMRERLMNAGYHPRSVEQLFVMIREWLIAGGYDWGVAEQLLRTTEDWLGLGGYDRRVVQQLLRITREQLTTSGYDEKLVEQLLRMTEERLIAGGNDRIADLLESWLEYSGARANMPPEARERMRQVLRQLMKGHYHRFAHGLGSALRDIRNPPDKHSPRKDRDPKSGRSAKSSD